VERLPDSKHYFYMNKYYGSLEAMKLFQQYKYHRILAYKPNKPTFLFGNNFCNDNKVHNILTFRIYIKHDKIWIVAYNEFPR
jgi:hypothetical protein